MKKQGLIFFLFITGLFSWMRGQAPEIQIRNFKVIENHTDQQSMRNGILLDFDLHYITENQDISHLSFDMYWRFMDKDGNTLYDSRYQQNKNDRKETVSLSKPWNNNNANYLEDDYVKIFIPYNLIKVSEGAQSVQLSVSLENDNQNLIDCARQEFEYTQKKVETHTFKEQEFYIRNLVVDYEADGFGTDEPGMKISYEVEMKYPAGQVGIESFTISWLMKDSTGKEIFNSDNATSIHHKSDSWKMSSVKDGKIAGESIFIEYNDIRINKPGKAELVFKLTTPEKESKIVSTGMMHWNFPVKYAFKDQEFSVSNISAQEKVKDGVHGLGITFDCEFKYNGVRADPEVGSYFFYLILSDKSGKPAFDLYKTAEQSGSTTLIWLAVSPDKDSKVKSISLFLPYHRLTLPAGQHQLKYSLNVCDKTRQIKFPELGSGNISLNQPQLVKYHLAVRRIEVVPSNYDPNLFGAGDPDLRWRLQVGNDMMHSSPMVKNSLVAATGEETIIISYGDEISIELYDVDNGFFNANDLLGTWVIPYEGKGDDFTYDAEKQGLLDNMSVSIHKVN